MGHIGWAIGKTPEIVAQVAKKLGKEVKSVAGGLSDLIEKGYLSNQHEGDHDGIAKPDLISVLHKGWLAYSRWNPEQMQKDFQEFEFGGVERWLEWDGVDGTDWNYDNYSAFGPARPAEVGNVLGISEVDIEEATEVDLPKSDFAQGRLFQKLKKELPNGITSVCEKFNLPQRYIRDRMKIAARGTEQEENRYLGSKLSVEQICARIDKRDAGETPPELEEEPKCTAQYLTDKVTFDGSLSVYNPTTGDYITVSGLLDGPNLEAMLREALDDGMKDAVADMPGFVKSLDLDQCEWLLTLVQAQIATLKEAAK
jgi:hypothetical protein